MAGCFTWMVGPTANQENWWDGSFVQRAFIVVIVYTFDYLFRVQRVVLL